jgi:hypothetical protein
MTDSKQQDPKPSCIDLAVSDITPWRELQHRIEGVDKNGVIPSLVEKYRELLEDGAPFPPVTVVWDAQKGKRWLVGGFHRYYAHLAAGRDKVSCEVYRGNYRFAVLKSYGENAHHGVNLTPGELRALLFTVFEDPEWAKWTDERIAKEMVHCSRQSVGRYKKEWQEQKGVGEGSGELDTLATPSGETRLGAGDRPIVVKNRTQEDKRTLRQQIAAEFLANPTASHVAVAKKLGTTDKTVTKHRKAGLGVANVSSSPVAEPDPIEATIEALSDTVDSQGQPIPERLKAVFADRVKLWRHVQTLRRILAWFMRVSDASLDDKGNVCIGSGCHASMRFIDVRTVCRDLQRVAQRIQAGIPFAICPACGHAAQGDEDCQTCGGSGFLPKSMCKPEEATLEVAQEVSA